MAIRNKLTFGFCGILILWSSIGYSQTKPATIHPPHKWMATFMTGGANSSTLRHFIRLSDGSLFSFKPGDEPKRVADIDQVRAISASSFHILALKEDGTVWAWGSNDKGQLGNTSLITRETSSYISYKDSKIPVQVSGITNAVDISAVGTQSYALLSDGSVMAWGEISHNGWSTIVKWRRPTRLQGITDGVALAGSMALLSNGSIMTWGDGKEGRLGNGKSTTSLTPVKVVGIDHAVAIAASDVTGMALLEDGTVKTWGANRFGILGNGKSEDDEPVADSYTEPLSYSSIPVKVKNLSRVKAISMNATAFALLEDGTLRGWGWGEIGALGGKHFDRNRFAIKIPGIEKAIAIKANKGGGFALLRDGTLMGWGADMIAAGTYRQTYVAITISEFGELAPR